MLSNNQNFLLTPLVLATTVAFANWGADPEETPMNDVTTNDEDALLLLTLLQ
jgi:hypothetical protein